MIITRTDNNKACIFDGLPTDIAKLIFGRTVHLGFVDKGSSTHHRYHLQEYREILLLARVCRSFRNVVYEQLFKLIAQAKPYIFYSRFDNEDGKLRTERDYRYMFSDPKLTWEEEKKQGDMIKAKNLSVFTWLLKGNPGFAKLHIDDLVRQGFKTIPPITTFAEWAVAKSFFLDKAQVSVLSHLLLNIIPDFDAKGILVPSHTGDSLKALVDCGAVGILKQHKPALFNGVMQALIGHLKTTGINGERGLKNCAETLAALYVKGLWSHNDVHGVKILNRLYGNACMSTWVQNAAYPHMQTRDWSMIHGDAEKLIAELCVTGGRAVENLLFSNARKCHTFIALFGYARPRYTHQQAVLSILNRRLDECLPSLDNRFIKHMEYRLRTSQEYDGVFKPLADRHLHKVQYQLGKIGLVDYYRPDNCNIM